MRGADITQEALFTTIKLDERVPHDHPLRSIKILFDQALTHTDWKLSLIYSERGRESIPPERLLRALLLQILFSIRSERQLVEQIQHTLVIGLSIDEPVWVLKALPGAHRKTVGADKNYDTRGFVKECRNHRITLHVARNNKRPSGSAIDG